MVHLLPLPGAPGYGGSFAQVLERAVSDAQALQTAGFDAVLVENYGDAPFHKDCVEPFTVAAMTEAAAAVRGAVNIPFGIQVLRNDASAGLGIAAVTGAVFIRVNVHTGAMVTDQGIIEGKADETVRQRAALGAPVQIFADVFVKHAHPLGDITLAQAASDTVHRGRADAVIVSGTATGAAVDERDVQQIRATVDAPLLIGSGATVETVSSLLSIADGVIAGTAVKQDGITVAPVDIERAQAFVDAARI
jgi:membrane complex biogenesis BtpA family protein